MSLPTYETQVLVIGGGVTGAGIMRDLSLRGISCLLVDRRDLCAGASGGNHGLLHSGARYVSNDLHSAIECRQENALLKKLAPHCVEDTGGLFIAVEGDDPQFAGRFPELCEQAGIVCQELDPAAARQLEPHLAGNIVKAFAVPDATIDPFRLALDNVADARNRGSEYLAHREVKGFELAGGRIVAATIHNHQTGSLERVVADHYINAAGAWAMALANLAGCNNIRLSYSKGTLLVTHDRLTKRVINRLRAPGDGDILVPGGTVSVLGTTSTRVETLEGLRPTIAEVELNINEGAALCPSLATTRYIRAFSRVRPLLLSDDQDDRSLTRGFALVGHEAQGLDNFTTITGGKLTTFRLMAEKTADLVATKLGVTNQGLTTSLPLPPTPSCSWTEPGASPRVWFKRNEPEDQILCECEMVPQSAVAEIVASAPGAKEKLDLAEIALRSRAGKGPCQGSFCGIRITSFLYDHGHYQDPEGLTSMRNFFEERFKGMRPIIWGQQAAQMELAEALHRGLLGLDNLDSNQGEA